ncbi:PTS sugar transporter subunit IIA [Sphingomonas donggukensis]|uniref:PTS sugar transporter subunit IIA n=1 Tax=Sphingomonas donggukensis TaxID=2949093 RepID=A0ABY4TUW9_9SPHN|nr:PTS sugar transporter subunit IIA [Sphingomonas donggukensis]URW75267.1 PTS sugar transporter subunit IIA [Sphingomonas donggukensis]
MTDLSDMIALDCVLPDVSVGTKRALFTALGAASASALGLDAGLVATRLADREKLGTTGFGGGIAVPHARIEGLPEVRGIFARLTRGIDFAAVDDLPVDLVFMLLSPPDAGADHLKALARVSRRLRDRGLAEKLRGAGSRDALYALLTGIGARDAA